MTSSSAQCRVNCRYASSRGSICLNVGLRQAAAEGRERCVGCSAGLVACHIQCTELYELQGSYHLCASTAEATRPSLAILTKHHHQPHSLHPKSKHQIPASPFNKQIHPRTWLQGPWPGMQSAAPPALAAGPWAAPGCPRRPPEPAPPHGSALPRRGCLQAGRTAAT